jgi:hypothetical protein
LCEASAENFFAGNLLAPSFFWDWLNYKRSRALGFFCPGALALLRGDFWRFLLLYIEFLSCGAKMHAYYYKNFKTFF